MLPGFKVALRHLPTMLMLLALSCLTIVAQSGPTGSLTGTVVDQNGAPVPGVTVTTTKPATGEHRSALTNSDGIYTLPALPTGSYQVSFRGDGFKTASIDRVSIEAAVPITLNITMEVGYVEEVVTVSTEAQVLQTTSAAVTRQLNSTELIQVPSSTRNFTHLTTATTGVNSDLPPVATNDTGSISPSVNGAKTTSNSVQYNGIDITSLLSNTGSLDENLVPAPETIDEVKLQASLYDASTGRSGGGNFQLVSKSGSNEWHGSAYVFTQNEKFNANDFFFNRSGLAKPKMRRLEPGFTLGGPFKSDRAFFFTSYQYTDATTGYVPTASSRAFLPLALNDIQGERTAENLVAAFSARNPCIRNAAGASTGGFCLTPAQISPISLALLNTRNPLSGGFIIPAPGNGAVTTTDRTVSIAGLGGFGGDPLAELRQVIPSEFTQHQLNLRTDLVLSSANRMNLSYFFSDFPSLDNFPDPSSLSSPFTLRRSNRGQVISFGDQHVFGPTLINELRVGYFTLRNTRRLDDAFLDLTSESFGIFNPALLFDDRDATRRLGHFVTRGGTFSFGGPNDSFNKREQRTFQLSDSLSLIKGNHSFRFGGDLKFHGVDNNLPEEQATEFEKIENFQHFLQGLTSEADTQFGFTSKEFRSRDLDFFISDDWRVTQNLTLNLGLRWDWYGWPIEKNGFLGNFDPALVEDPGNPITGFIVPSNVTSTGISQVDSAIAATARVNTKSTLHGEDLNNFAPRLGFAYTLGEESRWVLRGGYGIYYDRPSAAFINTVFSNYPFLREIEVTQPSGRVSYGTAYDTQLINGQAVPFEQYFPFIIRFSGGRYSVLDTTGIGGIGNPAETLEFRAIDRNLKTPFYHQFNFGAQYQISSNTVVEARYAGSRGRNLLLASALNQPYDLNDPSTPQIILDRITAAYRAGGGTANAQDPNALGYGYGGNRNNGPTGTITTEARVLYLGINDAEAVYLQSIGRSSYDSLQVSVARRFSRGFQFNAAYTFSKSQDLFSAEPGSTAGGGRPDVPNVGFSVENDSRNIEANFARSDFDRPHRFSLSAVYELPFRNPVLRDIQLATYMQLQSGRPFSVFVPEAGLLRLAFQRLDLAPGATLDDVRRQGNDPVSQFFNTNALTEADGAGNTPRNFLRGPQQSRFDLSVTKAFRFTESSRLELKAEIFNLLNRANFDIPDNDFDSRDFGSIVRTIGGPRVMQFGARLIF